MSTPTPASDPAQSLSDDVIAALRTYVPVIWGAIAAWLINLGVPASVLAEVHGIAVAGLAGILTIIWYTLWRWASPYIPQWIVVIVLGYAANPIYKPIQSARARRAEPATGPQIPAPRTE